MKIMGLILAMLSLIFTGCGSLIVKDINSQPISGVKFSTDSKYEVSKEDSRIPGMSPTKKYEHFEATSNELGEIDLLGNSFEVGKLSKENYLSLYITKNGEYTMYKIDDYFSDEFLKKEEYRELKNKIGKFIVDIEKTAYYKNANVVIKKIDILSFKNNKYISIYFNSELIYNDLKIDKYQVGKKLYEDLVVKILDYLVLVEDEHIAGVNLNVTGYSKNFINELGKANPIQFSFIMDKGQIKYFKEKDITSQKLLDNSVILMDNERIELKLQ